MKSILLATAALLAMTMSSNAIVIADLGVNPTSALGSFNNNPGIGPFRDQYTFQLVGFPQFITIAEESPVST